MGSAARGDECGVVSPRLLTEGRPDDLRAVLPLGGFARRGCLRLERREERREVRRALGSGSGAGVISGSEKIDMLSRELAGASV